MCQLCGETRAEGISAARRMAEDLRQLARLFDYMANGTLDPHGNDIEGVGLKARSIVRRLVEDFV